MTKAGVPRKEQKPVIAPLDLGLWPEDLVDDAPHFFAVVSRNLRWQTGHLANPLLVSGAKRPSTGQHSTAHENG